MADNDENSAAAQLAQAMRDLESLRRDYFDVAARVMEADDRKMFPQDLVCQAVVYRALNLIDGFGGMIERRNLLCAAVLIRLQIDSVMRFYALNLVDDVQPLVTALLSGEPLRKIKTRDGEPLTDRLLRDKASEVFPFVNPVYERASGFVHLSSPHMLTSVRAANPDGRTVTFVLREDGNQDWTDAELVEHAEAFLASTRATLSMCRSWLTRKEQVAEERNARTGSATEEN